MRRTKKDTATSCSFKARQGPSEDTQAMPLLPKGKRAPTFMRSSDSIFAGLERNAKNLVQYYYLFILTFTSLSVKNIYLICPLYNPLVGFLVSTDFCYFNKLFLIQGKCKNHYHYCNLLPEKQIKKWIITIFFAKARNQTLLTGFLLPFYVITKTLD